MRLQHHPVTWMELVTKQLSLPGKPVKRGLLHDMEGAGDQARSKTLQHCWILNFLCCECLNPVLQALFLLQMLRIPCFQHCSFLQMLESHTSSTVHSCLKSRPLFVRRTYSSSFQHDFHLPDRASIAHMSDPPLRQHSSNTHRTGPSIPQGETLFEKPPAHHFFKSTQSTSRLLLTRHSHLRLRVRTLIHRAFITNCI
jgi:hypothetical protein